MSHTFHPDTHTHGLADDCPECARRADWPQGLDTENLIRIWTGQCKTETDWKARNTLYRSVLLTHRLAEAYGIGADIEGMFALARDRGVAL